MSAKWQYCKECIWLFPEVFKGWIYHFVFRGQSAKMGSMRPVVSYTERNDG